MYNFCFTFVARNDYNMIMNEIPHVGFDTVGSLDERNLDITDDGIAIFNTINDLPLNTYPTRIVAAVMAVILKGELTLTINLKEYHVEAHNLILLMPNQIIQTITKSEDFEGVYIAISRQAVNDMTTGPQNNLNTFLYAQEQPITTISTEEEESLMEYHTFIWKQIKSRGNIYKRQISNYLILSLSLEIMNIVNKHRPVSSIPKTRKEEQFERFLALMSDFYAQNRSVSFYADKMCITPKYLSSLCKSLTGTTASGWIDWNVILEAKAMLKNSNFTVQEVSEKLNFPNQSFFGKYFKHHVGVSPKEYRNRK